MTSLGAPQRASEADQQQLPALVVRQWMKSHWMPLLSETWPLPVSDGTAEMTLLIGGGGGGGILTGAKGVSEVPTGSNC